MSQGPVPITSQPTHSLHLDDCRRKQSNLTDQLLLFFSFWAYRELIKHNLFVDFSTPLTFVPDELAFLEIFCFILLCVHINLIGAVYLFFFQ